MLDRWIEEYNGMKGRWKTYYPAGQFSFRVFHPLAAGECPHENYEVDSASVSRRYQYKDGTYGSQYITAYVCCDDCGEYGEISFSCDEKSLKQSYSWIDWNATRPGLFIGWKDTGYWEWFKSRPYYVPPPEDEYAQARLEALAEVGITDG